MACGQITLSRNHCVHVVIQSPTAATKEGGRQDWRERKEGQQGRSQGRSHSSSSPLQHHQEMDGGRGDDGGREEVRRSKQAVRQANARKFLQQAASTESMMMKKNKKVTTSSNLTQPYKAESNHRDYSTKASMDRAREFVASLKRVESIVNAAMQRGSGGGGGGGGGGGHGTIQNKSPTRKDGGGSGGPRAKQAQTILSSLDTNHTGILDRRTFALACRRLQLGLSRTDIDALIAFLRSRNFAAETNKKRNLTSGCVRWRWFMMQFCGAKYNLPTVSAAAAAGGGGGSGGGGSGGGGSGGGGGGGHNEMGGSSLSSALQKKKQQHDYSRVISGGGRRVGSGPRHHDRPRTADTIEKARQLAHKKQKSRPASSGARDTRLQRRKVPPSSQKQLQQQQQQRPQQRPSSSSSHQENKNSLASMASALQRRGNSQDWTFFASGDRRSHKDIANMMLRKPTSPMKARTKRRSSPLLTARLRPFFGTVYNGGGSSEEQRKGNNNSNSNRTAASPPVRRTSQQKSRR